MVKASAVINGSCIIGSAQGFPVRIQDLNLVTSLIENAGVSVQLLRGLSVIIRSPPLNMQEVQEKILLIRPPYTPPYVENGTIQDMEKAIAIMGFQPVKESFDEINKAIEYIEIEYE